MVVWHLASQHQQQDQSLTSDVNHATMTPPTDATISSHLDPLNFHVSARLNLQNRDTNWDLLLNTIRQIQVDEQREEAAAEELRQFPPVLLGVIKEQLAEEKRVAAAAALSRQQPTCSPPPPPEGRVNPMNYRTVWLTPNGKKAHISLECVHKFKPYYIKVMPGSCAALNWCQRCSNPAMLEAFNKVVEHSWQRNTKWPSPV